MNDQDLIKQLRSENERMRDLLDRRPAMNMGLLDAYAKWTELCYYSDMVAKPQEVEVH